MVDRQVLRWQRDWMQREEGKRAQLELRLRDTEALLRKATRDLKSAHNRIHDLECKLEERNEHIKERNVERKKLQDTATLAHERLASENERLQQEIAEVKNSQARQASTRDMIEAYQQTLDIERARKSRAKRDRMDQAMCDTISELSKKVEDLNEIATEKEASKIRTCARCGSKFKRATNGPYECQIHTGPFTRGAAVGSIHLSPRWSCCLRPGIDAPGCTFAGCHIEAPAIPHSRDSKENCSGPENRHRGYLYRDSYSS